MRKIVLISFAIIGLVILYWYSLSIIEKESVSYVEDIKEQLKKEFYDNLDNAFIENSRLMYSEEYAGAEFTPIDMKAVRMIDERISESVVERLFPPYGRYHKEVSYLFMMYKPESFKDLEEMYAIKKFPWETILLKRMDKKTLKLFNFIPIAVGYKQIESYLKSWRPSLEECCKDALEYLINEDEDYSTCYNPNNKRKVAEILKYYNRYYYLQPNNIKNDYNGYFSFESYERPKIDEADSYLFHKINYIYNAYYKVYYDIIPSLTYKVEFNLYNYKIDKEEFYSKYKNLSTIVFFVVLVPLIILLINSVYSYSKIRKNKIHIETVIGDNIEELYNKVISASNPQKFIDPYNPKKLAIANEIYAKAIENKENIILLKDLWKRIEIEL